MMLTLFGPYASLHYFHSSLTLVSGWPGSHKEEPGFSGALLASAALASGERPPFSSRVIGPKNFYARKFFGAGPNGTRS